MKEFMTQENMKTPIEYIIVAVPFHADAATHDELARKVNEKLNGWLRTAGAAIPQQRNDVSAHDETHSASFPTSDPMKKTIPITTLFLDIGGVQLTDGWDHHARKRAAKHFKLNWAEMEQRHSLNFNIYEEDKLTLDEYLGWLLFYQKRPFTRAEFRRFMFAQSKPYPEMIELIRQLKAKYDLKIIVLSNEARELNAHRIRTFKLDEFVDAFVSSCFVHLHKPDAAIFRMALDIAQTPPADRLSRKHAAVRADRGRSGDSRTVAHGLPIQRAQNWLRWDCRIRTTCSLHRYAGKRGWLDRHL